MPLVAAESKKKRGALRPRPHSHIGVEASLWELGASWLFPDVETGDGQVLSSYNEIYLQTDN